nr:integrase, catalytic region, zinc finger, CCHC-type, peptidase aspartic, catalytic [Tanacetum cinerariifolium]
RLTKKAIRIAQSKALSPDVDEPASLSRDDRHREAFPTVSSLDAGQDKEIIAKTFAMSYESSPRVPSLDADDGSMQQRLHELMELCTSLQRQQSQMADKIKDQDIEISGLKARVKPLEDKERRREEPIQEDAPITRGIIDIWEELGADKSTKKGSNDTEKIVNVLSSMVQIFCQVEEQLFQLLVFPLLMSFQLLVFLLLVDVFPLLVQFLPLPVWQHHIQEEKTKLISELVKYQDYLAEILKYQAQQSKPSSKKEQRKFYMSVLKSHDGWKIEHFRGMTLEQIKEKFIPIWKHMQDFVPMSSKEKSEKVKKPGIKLDQGSLKRVKISHTSRSEPLQEQQFKGSKGVSKEELKGMMQLVPLKEVYIEALQVKHPIIDWEIHSEGKREYWKIIRLRVKETFSITQSTRDKENEIWVELKRLFEPDYEDQLWTYHQAFMHDPLDWKLYDTCGVHHVSTKKNQEIFMLVEKDYLLRKGLAIVMIIQDEELFEASSPDTRPPMLDRTDFASWQQRIGLYYRGKENGVNILKSNDEGPYRMGTVRETLAESREGAPQFGPERPREYSDLTPEEKDWYNADIRATNILLQGLPKDIYTLINHYTDAKDI